jgi:hypothetical protein
MGQVPVLRPNTAVYPLFLFPIFHLQIFKPNTNFCFEFQVSNFTHNPNVNIILLFSILLFILLPIIYF